MRSAAGAVTLLLAVTLLMLIDTSSRDDRDADLPASFLRSGAVLVQLGQGFADREQIRQLDGAPTLVAVMELAQLPVAPGCAARAATLPPLAGGARVDLIVQHGVVEGFSLGWMPAAQRVASGILLHPDRMNRADWEFLPGVGTRLAERIERDRQINGDFGTLQGVQRVRGIGAGQIQRWRRYFFSAPSS